MGEGGEGDGGPAVRLGVVVDGDYDGVIDQVDPEIHLTATRGECARLAGVFRPAAAKPLGEVKPGSVEAIVLVAELDRQLVAGSAFFGVCHLDEDLGRLAQKPEEESELWDNLKSFVGVFGPPLLLLLLGRGLFALLSDLRALL